MDKLASSSANERELTKKFSLSQVFSGKINAARALFFNSLLRRLKLSAAAEKMKRKFHENVNRLLECPICLEQIRQPKMLDCQHSFCFDPCLKNMAEDLGPTYRLECAICRKISLIQNLENIADNLHLKNLVDIKNAEDQEETNEMGTVHYILHKYYR